MRALGTEPVALAVTATFSQIAFGKSLGVDFPMLSDWEGTVANAYGVQYDVWKGHTGLAKRSVFLVDGEGRVRYRWVSDDALEVPDLYEALDAIEALTTSDQAGAADDR